MRFLTLVAFMLTLGACQRPIENNYNYSTVPVSFQPATAAQCPSGGILLIINGRGTPVCNGATGPQGLIGETGGTGPQGLPGIDSNPISVVQLCPGVTTYPSVFVEVGVCFQNNLYAVYSTHGGFMTLIPPGNYTSNALGSQCNLTVGPNCAVSY